MARKWLSTNEVKQLRKIVREYECLDKANGRFLGIRDRALVELLLSTGVRATECRNIQIKDLYLDTRGSEPYIMVETLKRKRSVVDTITISKDLRILLKEYLKELAFHGKPTSNDSFLFPGRYGNKLTLNSLEKCIKRIFFKCGLPSYYSVHSLRHTHGHHLYNSSRNLKLVQLRLRHSSIQTSGIYIGVAEGEEKAVINTMYG